MLVTPLIALTATPPAAGAVPTCEGRPATIVGTSGDDRLLGTDGIDVIVARGGNDDVTGRDGADVICAGHGDDTIDGGTGDDIIRSGPDRDVLSLGGADRVWAGGGTDIVVNNDIDVSGSWVSLGAGRDGGTFLMTTGGTVQGDAGKDFVIVTTYGGAKLGLHGGTDDNWLALNLRVDAQTVDVVIDQTAGTIALDGSTGTFVNWNHFQGFGWGRWTYRGSNGSDDLEIHGGSLNASLLAGNDRAISFSGHDDFIDGGAGDDRIRAFHGYDDLVGGPGNDLLDGGYHWDLLDGGPGDDRLIGGEGRDTLDGGDGWDYGDDPVPPNALCSVEVGDCVVS